LILRAGRSLRADNAGRIVADDQVYIVAATEYLPLLDQLFAGPAESEHDPHLYGEFLLDPEAKLRDVAAMYDATVAAGDADMTLRDFLTERLHGDAEPGDRVNVGRIDLIVRAVTETHGIEEIGLGVEPEAEAHLELPPAIAAVFRRFKRKGPAAPEPAAPSDTKERT
jgi:cell volume regulation protein A